MNIKQIIFAVALGAMPMAYAMDNKDVSKEDQIKLNEELLEAVHGMPWSKKHSPANACERVKSLLARRADVNYTKDGETPLALALAAGNREVCRLLVDAGTSDEIIAQEIYKLPQGTRPDVDEIKSLLCYKLKCNFPKFIEAPGWECSGYDERGYYKAFYQGQENGIRRVGVDQEKLIAALNEPRDATKALLVCLNRLKKANDPCAILLCNKLTLKPLLDQNIRANYKPLKRIVNYVDDNGFTPLILVAASESSAISFQRYADIAQVLLAAGAHVNAKNLSQESALTRAVLNQNYEMCKVLIDHGAALNDQDEYGNTPLMYAINGIGLNPKIVRLLIERGADLNYLIQSCDVFEIALQTRNLDVCKVLIDAVFAQPQEEKEANRAIIVATLNEFGVGALKEQVLRYMSLMS